MKVSLQYVLNLRVSVHLEYHTGNNLTCSPTSSVQSKMPRWKIVQSKKSQSWRRQCGITGRESFLCSVAPYRTSHLLITIRTLAARETQRAHTGTGQHQETRRVKGFAGFFQLKNRTKWKGLKKNLRD